MIFLYYTKHETSIVCLCRVESPANRFIIGLALPSKGPAVSAYAYNFFYLDLSGISWPRAGWFLV